MHRKKPLALWTVVLWTACTSHPPPPIDSGVDSGECAADLECDDGAFCSGAETCVGGSCRAGAPPCEPGMCDESADRCGTCNSDVDGDGALAPECGGSDCDDSDPQRFPGNVEVCDDHDEDCDPESIGARDVDGDGETSSMCCNADRCGTDCDDTTLARRSLQPEFCDDEDNDCDGGVDEMATAVPWYEDGDGDGFGASGSAPEISCAPVPDRSLASSDCDDSRAGVSRVGTESCNGSDDDCDGEIDESPARCGMDGGMVVADDGGVEDAGGDGGAPQGSCGTSTGSCREYAVDCASAALAARMSECASFGGTWSSAPCSRVGTVIGCRLPTADGTLVEWNYRTIDLAAYMAACSSSGGTVLAGTIAIDAGARDSGPLSGSDSGPPSERGAYEICDGEAGSYCESGWYCSYDTVLDPGVCTPSCSGGAPCPSDGSGSGVCVSESACFRSCTSDADCGVERYCAPPSAGMPDRACLPRPAVRNCVVPSSITVAMASFAQLTLDGGSSASDPCALIEGSSAYGALVFWQASPLSYPRVAAGWDRGAPVRIVSLTPRAALDLGSTSMPVPLATEITVRFVVTTRAYDATIRITNPDPASLTVTLVAFSACDETTPAAPYYADVDADGVGAGPALGMAVCDPPVGHSFRSDDCDDFANERSPAFHEVCDGFENDCDGTTDDGSPESLCLQRPRSTMSCVSGSCALTACVTGYSSCDGAADPGGNGCETQTGGDDQSQCGGCDQLCIGRCTAGSCALEDSAFVGLSSISGGMCARRASGGVACWGRATIRSRAGLADADWPVTVVGFDGATQIVGGNGTLCALVPGGRVRCVGSGNALGSVVPPGEVVARSGIEVPGINDAVELASAGSAMCARRSTGGIVCWGDGALGSATVSSSLAPIAVAGISDAISISGAYDTMCVARVGGSVLCWGNNGFGQSGDGTTTPRPTPRTVTGVSGATRVESYVRYACAIIAGGAVRCWGDGRSGVLGDGMDRPGPQTATTVMAVSGATDIALGGREGCVRSSTGSWSCWGDTGSGPTIAAERPDLAGAELEYARDGTHACIRTATHVYCNATDESLRGDGPLGDGIVRSGVSGYCLYGLDWCTGAGETCYRWSGGSLSCASAPIVTETVDAVDDPSLVTSHPTAPQRLRGTLSSSDVTDCYGVSVSAGAGLTVRTHDCSESTPVTVALYDGSGGYLYSNACSMRGTAMPAGNFRVCIGDGGYTGAYDTTIATSAP